eukprot:scaffold161028_cov50-Prasinocladus_malaysianus.AAC.1
MLVQYVNKTYLKGRSYLALDVPTARSVLTIVVRMGRHTIDKIAPKDSQGFPWSYLNPWLEAFAIT